MNQINQWQAPSPWPTVSNSVLPRSVKRTTKSVIEKVQLDALEMAGDERLTELAIDGVARLDALRLIKARTAEANALMFELESGFAQRSARKIANRNSALGGL